MRETGAFKRERWGRRLEEKRRGRWMDVERARGKGAPRVRDYDERKVGGERLGESSS